MNLVSNVIFIMRGRAFKMFDSEESHKVAVLAGRGGNFCAGYDLKELSHSNTSSVIERVRISKDVSPMVLL